MKRTQIYLTEKQKKLLEAESLQTGESISNLIRKAIDFRYEFVVVPDKPIEFKLLKKYEGKFK